MFDFVSSSDLFLYFKKIAFNIHVAMSGNSVKYKHLQRCKGEIFREGLFFSCTLQN